MRADPKLKLAQLGIARLVRLMINQDNGPKSNNPLGKDPRVRRAFELALDRDAINQVVFNGEFVPGNQWVSPQSPYYQKDFSDPQAGHRQGQGADEGGRHHRQADARLHGEQRARIAGIAEVVQSLVAEAGFDLKLRVVEVATALKAGEDGDFQVYALTWSGRSDPDGNSVIYQTCGAPQNMAKYCDKELDGWHQEARAATELDARKAIYRKVTERFLDKGWIFYLYHHPQNLATHTVRLEGFRQCRGGCGCRPEAEVGAVSRTCRISAGRPSGSRPAPRPAQRVRVAVVEGRRLAPHRQVGARHVGPGAVIVEGDVDAVIVGPESFFEEGRRADAETSISTLGFDRDRLVSPGFAMPPASTTWPRGMAMDCMIRPVAGSQSHSRPGRGSDRLFLGVDVDVIAQP